MPDQPFTLCLDHSTHSLDPTNFQDNGQPGRKNAKLDFSFVTKIASIQIKRLQHCKYGDVGKTRCGEGGESHYAHAVQYCVCVGQCVVLALECCYAHKALPCRKVWQAPPWVITIVKMVLAMPFSMSSLLNHYQDFCALFYWFSTSSKGIVKGQQ